MKNFGYCIWCTSSEFPEKINAFTNGFRLHMSVRTHYKTLGQAKLFFNTLPKKINIEVEFVNMIYSDDTEFACVYFTIKNKEIMSNSWWPKNSHISFHYSYDGKINETVRDKIAEKVKNMKEIKLDGFHLMNCNGDFHEWKFIC